MTLIVIEGQIDNLIVNLKSYIYAYLFTVLLF